MSLWQKCLRAWAVIIALALAYVCVVHALANAWSFRVQKQLSHIPQLTAEQQPHAVAKLLADAKRAVALAPNSAHYQHQLGWAYLKALQVAPELVAELDKTALRAPFAKAISLRPKFAPVYADRAILNVYLGEPHDVINQDLTQALAISPYQKDVVAQAYDYYFAVFMTLEGDAQIAVHQLLEKTLASSEGAKRLFPLAKKHQQVALYCAYLQSVRDKTEFHQKQLGIFCSAT